MESVELLDRAGRLRSPATLSGFHQGRVPRNKGSCRRRHEPLLRDGRPQWKPGMVATTGGDQLHREAQNRSSAQDPAAASELPNMEWSSAGSR